MDDQDKTKEELTEEIVYLRRRLSELEHVNEALQTSESRFQALFENMGNAVAVYKAEQDGEDFVLIDFNKAAEKIEQISRSEVVGKSVLKVFPGVKEFGLFDVFKRVWRTGRAEYHPLSDYKDNRIQGWRENFVYRLPSGEVVAVYSDETERKKGEQALRENEARYKAIFQGASEGILVADPRTTEFKYANPAVCEMLGYTEDELMGLNLSAIHPKDKLDYVLAEFQAIARREKSKTEDLPCLRKDGTIFYANVGGASITIDGLPYNVGFFSDNTARKRAEQALHESEQRFRAIFEGAEDHIFLKDRSLRYMDANPAVGKLFGIPTSEIIGRTHENLFGVEGSELTRESDLRVLEGETIEGEQIRKVYGIPMTFLYTKSPLRDDSGQVIGILSISHDITERKRVEVSPIIIREYPSKAMRSTLKSAILAAKNDTTVLLTGTSGSGKDYLARYIHDHSNRASGPYFTVNCAAIPHEIAESELFGHEKGAFTGAVGRKRGLLELAESGTLLFNEIGDLPTHVAGKVADFPGYQKI